MHKLIAEQLASDPRVSRGRELLLEALKDHQNKITAIRKADPDLTQSYNEMINQFGELRAGPLFFPYIGSGIGNGPFVELADGSVKYDFISGIGVHHWGHSHPAMVDAALDAAMSDLVMQGNLQQNSEAFHLGRILLAAANDTGAILSHCFFSTSGAMANENALKIIFQKKRPADRLLAFEGCFAGRTLALSQVTDNPAYRVGLPATISVDYIPAFDPARPEESTRISATHLERHLSRFPGRHAAMVFELVQGEGGFYPGSQAFFTALMRMLKESNIAVMADEIQTFGRTTRLFAYQHFGLDHFVDVVTVGKLLQVCATLFTGEFKPAPGLLSQTFTSGTFAFHAAKTIVTGLLQGDYFGPDGRIARLHDHFTRRLKMIEERRPDLIRGPYGIGGMVAFTPFGGDAERVKKFVHALFHNGVLGFYCGHKVARVRFLVPVGAASEHHIDEVCDIVEKTLLDMADQV